MSFSTPHAFWLFVLVGGLALLVLKLNVTIAQNPAVTGDPYLVNLMMTAAPNPSASLATISGTVDTGMIQNEATYRLFRPDLPNPGPQELAEAGQAINALPIPWLDPVDISNAVLFLASDEARYITGVTLPVDAGFLVK